MYTLIDRVSNFAVKFIIFRTRANKRPLSPAVIEAEGPVDGICGNDDMSGISVPSFHLDWCEF